jgi:F-type H+-transporting ATPase subunit b
MELNWTTFGLEIINFLALLWILKRFLYRPVMQTLAERRAGIERTLAEARTTEARAATMKQQFEIRLTDWEQEKATARSHLQAELAAERTRKIEALEKELSAERERSAAQDAHRQDTQQRELAAQAGIHARQFASKLLARVAGPEMEGRLVQLFIEEIAALPEERLSAVRAGQNDHGQGVLRTAYELPEAQRQQLSIAIGSRLGQPVALEFIIDPKLFAGVRLSLGAWQLDFSLAGELGVFPEPSNLVR